MPLLVGYLRSLRASACWDVCAVGDGTVAWVLQVHYLSCTVRVSCTTLWRATCGD